MIDFAQRLGCWRRYTLDGLQAGSVLRRQDNARLAAAASYSQAGKQAYRQPSRAGLVSVSRRPPARLILPISCDNNPPDGAKLACYNSTHSLRSCAVMIAYIPSYLRRVSTVLYLTIILAVYACLVGMHRNMQQ